MLPGGSVGARHLRESKVAEFRKDFRIEGSTNLRSAEYRRHLRADEILCPRAGTAAGAATSKARSLRYEEVAAHGQGPGGLESELRSQDHGVRILIAR